MSHIAALVRLACFVLGRLLGIYVVFVFLVAQLISWLLFAQPPNRAMLVGGAFVLAGGAIMSASP